MNFKEEGVTWRSSATTPRSCAGAFRKERRSQVSGAWAAVGGGGCFCVLCFDGFNIVQPRFRLFATFHSTFPTVVRSFPTVVPHCPYVHHCRSVSTHMAGIITIEDVIERIIKEDIDDETEDKRMDSLNNPFTVSYPCVQRFTSSNMYNACTKHVQHLTPIVFCIPTTSSITRRPGRRSN